MTATAPLILIPARMAATRLPGKPLADIAGLPMIVQVLRRAEAAGIGRVAVATDADEIAAAVKSHGGEVVMTRADHPSGSDRIFEALDILDPEQRTPVVINLQGDFPTIRPEQIGAVLAPLRDPAVDIATLAAEIHTAEESTNPNVVKVVGSPLGGDRLRALYFTRATAPFGEGPRYHHIGLYAYRRPALARFVALPPSPLEQREKLEQLRALEAGMRIDVTIVDTVPRGVDTPADLETARRMLASQTRSG
ncbi:MAG: 3-deoxy-manno-octulosonate cytidylyltransferase [Xanthobacteraceae bacterium]|nr:3-deoxy-manno-octulosonate cytidylyltransferase [Xanthobacteraceae bacterium]